MRKRILTFLALFYLFTIAYAFVLAETPSEKENLDSFQQELEKNDPQNSPQDSDDPFEKEASQTEEDAPIPSEPLPGASPPVLSPEEVASIEENKVTLERPPVGESPQQWGFTFMGGLYRPDDYKGRGNPYSEIYKSGGSTLGDRGTWIDLGLEWQFLKNLGRLGLKLFTGSWFIFKEYDSPKDSDTQKDTYVLWALPGLLGGVYRFHYWPKQPLIPFIEGGGGLLRFQQFTRDDQDAYRDIYRFAAMGGGGLQLNANILDPKASRSFDIDWGVNNTYFVAEYRVLKTYDNRIDSTSQKNTFNFSGSNLITGGLLFEF